MPLNWHFHPHEVAFVLAHCAAGAVVVAEETDGAVSAFDGEVAVLHVHGAYEALFDQAPAPLGVRGGCRS